MTRQLIKVSAQTVRRLAVVKQRLAGKLPSKTRDGIVSVVRDLAYVQWDPITIVAPSHVISLWSRVGNFRLADLEKLLWDEKKLFEHWTPIASLVLTEDYPIYSSMMRRYPESLAGSWKNHAVRAKKFLAEKRALRTRMLKELDKGPRVTGQFQDHKPKNSLDGWSPSSDVSRMIFHMHMLGDVMVVGHQGNQNVWGLTKDFLPDWTPRTVLTEDEFESVAAERAIRALGSADAKEINYYFPRGRYRSLKKTLARLDAEDKIQRVTVEGFGKRDERFIHSEDLSLLNSLNDDFEPRVTLIAPFDNLIAGRGRTNRIFNFDYMHEQFLPQEKRVYGTYGLPILRGDQLIGRIDPRLDKLNGKLFVNSVHSEPRAPEGREVSSAIRETILEFADFLGAKHVEYTNRVPKAWKASLR